MTQEVFLIEGSWRSQVHLGIKIYRDRSKMLIGLSQGTYVDKVLGSFNMMNLKRG